MTALTVLYDPTCGLCRRAHEWLEQQRKLIELIFVPCKSEEARLRFPHLDHDLTARDLTVIGDQGEVYMGPKAWLMVLRFASIANGLTDSLRRRCCRPRAE